MISTWDLPPKEQIEAYNEKAGTWLATTLKQPGLKQWRAFRNPFMTTPEVMVISEFDSLASCLKWVESDDYAAVVGEMRAAGCTNAAVQLWGTSPLAPEPLKPPSG
jgi:heme-degrading monooxygenase HmoA